MSAMSAYGSGSSRSGGPRLSRRPSALPGPLSFLPASNFCILRTGIAQYCVEPMSGMDYVRLDSVLMEVLRVPLFAALVAMIELVIIEMCPIFYISWILLVTRMTIRITGQQQVVMFFR